jgi:hypothetical protein
MQARQFSIGVFRGGKGSLKVKTFRVWFVDRSLFVEKSVLDDSSSRTSYDEWMRSKTSFTFGTTPESVDRVTFGVSGTTGHSSVLTKVATSLEAV